MDIQELSDEQLRSRLAEADRVIDSLRRRAAESQSNSENDVSARLAATEKALAASEKMNRAILNASSDMVVRFDREGTCLEYCGREGLALSVEPEEFLGKRVDGVLPEVNAKRAMRFISAALATGEVQEYEFQLPMPLDSDNLNDFEARLVAYGNDEALFVCRNITQRKCNDLALRTSEERLKLALDAGRMGLWDWHAQTGEMNWSDGTFRLLGFEPGEVAPSFESTIGSMHPDDVDSVRKATEKALQDHTEFHQEFRYVWSDNSIHWVVACGRFIYDELGEAIQMLGIVADIDERKQAEHSLQESEQKYRSLFDNSVAGVSITTFSGQLLAANEAICDLLGYSQEELKQLRTTQVYAHPKEREAYVETLLRDGNVKDFHLELVKKNGASLWVSISSTTTKWQGNEVIASTIIDLTKRKQAEANFQRLVEEMNGIVFQCEVETPRMTYVSPHAEVLLGYPVSDWLAEPDFWLSHIHPDDRDFAANYCAQQVRFGRDHVIQYRMIAADGREVWIHDTVRLVRDESNKITHLHGVMLDISEQKKIEQDLQETEERFRLAAQSVSDLIWMRDLSNNRLIWYGDVGSTLGYEKGEFSGTLDAFLDRIHPEDYQRVLAASDKAIRIRENGRIEYRIRGKNGAYRHWVDSWNSVCDQKGVPIRLVGAVQDITDRKLAEELLKNNEEKYRTLIESSPCCIHQLDRQGRVLSMNRAGLEMLGVRDESSIVGLPYLQAVCGEDRERVARLLEDAFAGSSWDFEFRSTKGFDFRSTIVPQFNSEGKVDRLLGITQDITNHKRDLLKLAASEARYRLLMKDANDAIILIDADTGMLVDANQEAQEMLNRSHQEILNMHFAELYPVDKLERGGDQSLLKLIQAGGVSGELSVVDRDGRQIPVEVSSSVIQIEGSRVVQCIYRNLTERKRIEKELREKKAEIAKVSRLSTLGELTSGIAHELNQPLTAIANYVEAIKDIVHLEGYENEELLQLLSNLGETTFRTSTIISRLRGLFQKAISHRSTLNVNELVEELIAFRLPQLIQAHIQVQLELAEDLPMLVIDPIQIQQVLLNLIKNAQAAMDNTAKDSRVLTFHSRRVGETVELSVTDTGRGLPVENIERLFDYFYTTTPGGLGVGLQVCRTIMEAHQGSIVAKNNRTEGATFLLSFPLHKRDANYA